MFVCTSHDPFQKAYALNCYRVPCAMVAVIVLYVIGTTLIKTSTLKSYS